MAGSVRHLHSKLTTVLEASRLVRKRISNVAPVVFDIDSVDPDNLLGACGIASYTLSRVLRRSGVKCDLVMGRFWSSPIRDRGDHCWVYVESLDLIVDITATQFPDMPSEVHVTSGDDFRYKGELHNRQAVKDLKEWEGQSHIEYRDVLDRIVEDVTVQLFQSSFLAHVDSRNG
jgi:hypothetical protein